MSGIRGRSGRPALSWETHRLRGTLRPSRHGVHALAEAPVVEPVERRPRIRVPSHLSPEARLWYRHCAQAWKFERHQLMLLQRAAEAWDRGEAARKVIETAGLLVQSVRGGPRLNPVLKVEDANRKAFARLLQQLDL